MSKTSSVSFDLSDEQQRRDFQRLLEYVWNNSPFYRDYYNSHGLRKDDLGEISVADLPILSKRTLMENFDEAVTDPRLQKSQLERWIREVRDLRDLYHDEFVVIQNSGSSGQFGIFVYDRKAWQLINTRLATCLPPPTRTGDGKIRLAVYLTPNGHFGGVTTSVMLPQSVYEILVLSLLDNPDDVVRQLNAFQPHRLSGYASSISSLATLANQKKLNIDPQMIVVSGDPLSQIMEHSIQHAWQAPIYDVYATAESIFLGVKKPGQSEFELFDDLNIVEIIADDNVPAPIGKPGRVVVTNLYNLTLPILRYDLGDEAVRGDGPQNSSGTTIRDLQGRTYDALPVILDNGKLDAVHPLALSSFYILSLEQIQFVSLRPDYVRVDYVASENVDGPVSTEFQRILELKGAGRTRFDVLRVERIEGDRRTGKLQRVRLAHNSMHDDQPLAPVEPQPGVDTGASSRRTRVKADERNNSESTTNRYEHHRRVQARTYHPSGNFVQFNREEIDQSITARFEAQSRNSPERFAVHLKNQKITYSQLNYVANRLAHLILAERGVREGTVGLLFQQGNRSVSAILGVLKAGKTYVPLDPTYPKDRLLAILEDAQIHVIVSDDMNLALARELSREAGLLVNVDELDNRLPSDNPGLSVSPYAAAAIFYTSGTTGDPKGVIQQHRNVLLRVATDTNNFHFCSEDRLSLLSSPSYSVSLRNLFGGLLNGAALCPFNFEEEGLIHLADWMIQEEVTVYFSVPTVFRHFTENLNANLCFPKLRLIYLAGEAVTRRDFELYKEKFSDECVLVNSLASNEAGIIRQYFLDKTTQIGDGAVPAGYAVDGKKILILNDKGEQVPKGEAGVIAVRSAYLSPGYWNKPDLTGACFLRDTEGEESERVFLTGDMGRLLPDDCLLYLGRNSLRTKIRGARVDLGEVEAVIRRHPSVRDVIVIGRDEENEGRLIAYVVPKEGELSTAQVLRPFVAAKLPAYMIPSRFVLLDALPLTPNGKVDKRALPDPGRSRPELDAPFVAPRDTIESELIEILIEILSVDRIGVHDNFFDLGGHSLAVARLISRIADKFGVQLPLRPLFEAETIAAMAALITEKLAQTQEESVNRILTNIESLSDEEAGKFADHK